MNIVQLKLADLHPKQILLTEAEYNRLAARDSALLVVTEPLPLKQVKLAYIKSVLAHCRGNKAQAAKLLQISRETLYDWKFKGPIKPT